MYYSDSIITTMQANKILALKVEEALAGVKDKIISNLNQIGDGATRALYYTSCFTDNYQDVCSKLKHDDKRFIDGVYQLIKDRNIIFEMIRIYIDIHFKNKTEGRVQNVLRKVVAAGIHIYSARSTTNLVVIGIATAICQNYRFSLIVNERVNKISSIHKAARASTVAAVIGLNLYGLVQEAANSANSLKNFNAFYYAALYERNLEMMYFIIEPFITQNMYLNPFLITDDELADLIIKLAR